MPKVALSVDNFCSAYGVGRTTAYEEISSGRLQAKKVGRRTLIPVAAADEWLQSRLPAAPIDGVGARS
jgi:excisionase family DNA binding protein